MMAKDDYCNPNYLRTKMDKSYQQSNGTETKMIEILREISNVSGKTERCNDPFVADFIFYLTEIQATCKHVLGTPASNATTASTEAVTSSGSSTAVENPLTWHTDEAKIFLTVVFLAVGIVGLLGNLMTVAVIYRQLHSTMNYFLASLAVSDFLLIIVGVPFDLVSLWRGSIAPAVLGYCEATSTAISWFTFVSILIIVALTAERLVAICYPFSLRSWFTNGRVVHLLLAIWGFAFFPSLYIGLQFKQVITDLCGQVHLVDLGNGSCDFVSWTDFRYTFEVMMLLTFVLPILFIIYAYFRILKSLNEMTHNRTIRVELQNLNLRRLSGRETSQKAQRVVTKMLITVTVVFFICYLPYHVERLIVWYSAESCQQSTVCLLLYPITGLLQYVSATLNPIIYNLMSLRFRRAFRNLFVELFCRRHNHLNHSFTITAAA